MPWLWVVFTVLASGGQVLRNAMQKELTGTLGELTPLYEPAGLEAGAILLVGLGPRDRFDAGAAFTAGFTAAKRLAGKSRDSVAIVLPAVGDPGAAASALVEGMIVGTRSCGLRKTEPSRHPFGTLSLVAKLTTRCLDTEHDKGCGNEYAFYPPLARNVKVRPALAVEHAYSGKGVNQTWDDAGRRGAYLGSFEVR